MIGRVAKEEIKAYEKRGLIQYEFLKMVFWKEVETSIGWLKVSWG